MLLLALALFAFQDAPEINVTAQGDSYLVTVATFPETQIDAVNDLVAKRAAALCPGRGIEWGRLNYTGQLSAKPGAPTDVAEYRRTFRCGADVAAYPPAPRDWRASSKDEADATRAYASFYSAFDAGDFERAYAMFESHEASGLAAFAADSNRVLGLVGTGTRRVTGIAWYVNPQNAPHPGVYARITFDGVFSDAPVYCGALNLFRATDGTYRIVGNREHVLPDSDNPTAARIAEYRRNNCG